MLADPDGQWAQALFAAAQWYLGGVMSNGYEFNPGRWDWDNPYLLLSTVMTAISVVGDIGYDIHKAMVKAGESGGRFAYYSSKYRGTLGTAADNEGLIAKTDIHLDKNNRAIRMDYTPGDPYVNVHKGGKIISKCYEPPQMSWFYTKNGSGKYLIEATRARFRGNFSSVINNIAHTAAETAPFSALEWRPRGVFDFKKYFGRNDFGNAWGYTMTARDVGNTMWGGHMSIGYNHLGGGYGMTLISDGLSILSGSGLESPRSYFMQTWGYVNQHYW
jgi:hypothetical protein